MTQPITIFTDVIVLGCGAVGSATLYYLARSNVDVIGIEQYVIGHNRGSSHGETRAIRQAYFESPHYIPILQQAYQQWAALEAVTGKKLFEKVGVLEIGNTNSKVLQQAIKVAKQYNVKIEKLDSEEINRRYNGLHAKENSLGVFEPDAGYLHVEKCIKTQIDLAINFSAKIFTNQEILGWTITKAGDIIVKSKKHTFRAKKLIICAGGWTNQLLNEFRLPLKIIQKGLYWFSGKAIHDAGSLPVFFFDNPSGTYYGFPRLEGNVKIARHSGGRLLSLPEEVDYDPEEHQEIISFLDQHINDIDPTLVKRENCFYTMTPDENFIIDFFPNNHNVMFAAGLSGHGFKMSNTIGYYLAGMCQSGEKPEIINFLSMSRFSL